MITFLYAWPWSPWAWAKNYFKSAKPRNSLSITLSTTWKQTFRESDFKNLKGKESKLWVDRIRFVGGKQIGKQKAEKYISMSKK